MPTNEQRIAQAVDRMLAGEGRAINDLEPALRPTAHQLYVDAVRAGKHDRGVVHDLAPH